MRIPLRLISASLAAPLIVAATASVAAANFGAGLAGWWMFNETGGTVATDSSGSGNVGQLVGHAAFTSAGLLGSAVAISGPDGAVVVGHNPSLEPATGTIEVWVNTDQLQNSDVISKTTNRFVRRNLSGGFSVYGLRITTAGEAIAFIANDDPAAPGPWTFATSSAGLVVPGGWHHLAIRWDGQVVAIFVDGLQRASAPYNSVPGTGLSYSGNSPFCLGCPTAWAIPSVHFSGRMDEARFYDRARSDVEIFTDFITRGHKPAEPIGH